MNLLLRTARPLLFIAALAASPRVMAQDTLPPANTDNNAPQSQFDVSQNEPKRKRRIPPLGVDLEYFRFIDAKTRRVFGPTVLGLGPGIGAPSLSLKGRIGADLSILRDDKTITGQRNKFTVVFAGVEYRRAYIPPRALRAIAAAQEAARRQAAQSQTADPTSPDAPPANVQRAFSPPPVLPYYGASVGAVYANVEAPSAGVDGSGLGASGSVFVGLSLKQRVFLEARLRGATRTQSFNFSGGGVTLGVRF
jgi:hypothetical protein